MTVNTGVSTSLRRPQTFHKFTYLQGGRALTPLPQKLVLIGTQKGGTAVAGTIYQINDPVETDGLFGVGSQLALMCRKAFETSAMLGQGPQLYAVGVAEPGAGAQHTQTFTVTGTATESGNVIIRIAGRTLTIGVASGDVQNTVATALNAAIGALYALLPVTSGVAANVVTATHVSKGIGGNDVLYEVVKTPAGITVVTAQGVAGAGVSDETTALANVAGIDYDAIALENHANADVVLALAHVTVAWTATEKKWRWVFIAEPGTIGTATALAAASNDRGIIVPNSNGCRSLPGEIATACAVGMLSRSRPNGNWDGMTLPLYPPDDANAYTSGQVETALAAGLTPLTPVVDPSTRLSQQGVLKIEKLVTTCTTQGGQPFEALRDAAVPRTGAFLARQVDANYAARFGAAANPDGVLQDDDTVARIRDMIANLLYAAQDAKIVKNVDTDLAALVVETDPSAPGRVNADITYTVVLGLHQVACVHRVTVG